MGRMIDEDDLKSKMNNLLLVLLELDVFHLCCHQCQVGSMNVDDIPMGEYCRYVTMMICYIHS